MKRIEKPFVLLGKLLYQLFPNKKGNHLMEDILLCPVHPGKVSVSKDTFEFPLLVEGGHLVSLRVRPQDHLYHPCVKNSLCFAQGVWHSRPPLQFLTLFHLPCERNSGFSQRALTGAWRGGWSALWPQEVERWASWRVLKHKTHPQHCLVVCRGLGRSGHFSSRL